MSQTSDLYKKIAQHYEKLSSHIDNVVIKTDFGWKAPHMQLAIANTIGNPWDNCDPCDKQELLSIEPIEWKGDNKEEFESALSNHLFYALADYFTPDNKMWAVYKKNPDVDGDEGCISDEKHFLKIGQAMKYAQDLIKKYFRDKKRVIKFPDIEYEVPIKCFDDGPYASSVVIRYHRIG